MNQVNQQLVSAKEKFPQHLSRGNCGTVLKISLFELTGAARSSCSEQVAADLENPKIRCHRFQRMFIILPI